MESDEALRDRIRYVAGESREIEFAADQKLDELAWRYNLKRRQIDPERTQPIARREYKLDDRTWLRQHLGQWVTP